MFKKLISSLSVIGIAPVVGHWVQVYKDELCQEPLGTPEKTEWTELKGSWDKTPDTWKYEWKGFPLKFQTGVCTELEEAEANVDISPASGTTITSKSTIAAIRGDYCVPGNGGMFAMYGEDRKGCEEDAKYEDWHPNFKADDPENPTRWKIPVQLTGGCILWKGPGLTARAEDKVYIQVHCDPTQPDVAGIVLGTLSMTGVLALAIALVFTCKKINNSSYAAAKV